MPDITINVNVVVPETEETEKPFMGMTYSFQGAKDRERMIAELENLYPNIDWDSKILPVPPVPVVTGTIMY